MSKLRVGVVGVGHLGYHHARNYARMEDVDLVGVADMEPARLDEAKEKLGVRTFLDAGELIPHVDAVSVAVTTTAHYDVASQFLKKGIQRTCTQCPSSTHLECLNHPISMSFSFTEQ